MNHPQISGGLRALLTLFCKQPPAIWNRSDADGVTASCVPVEGEPPESLHAQLVAAHHYDPQQNNKEV